MRDIVIALLIFSAILTVCSVFAEEPDFCLSYLNSYPQTLVYAGHKVSNLDYDALHKAVGFVFIGGYLYVFDEEINDIFQRNKTDFTQNLATAANQFGEGKYMLSALGLTWLTGYVSGSEHTQDTALLSLKSFLLANGVSLTLKTLTQRERPFQNKGKEFFNGEGIKKSRESFPSGHTTIVWSIAPVLAEQYKQTRWVAPTAYGVAIMTSLARLHNERHWSSDVYAGALIGYFTAKTVLKTTPRLYVYPSADLSGVGLGFNF